MKMKPPVICCFDVNQAVWLIVTKGSKKKHLPNWTKYPQFGLTAWLDYITQHQKNNPDYGETY